MKPVKQVIIAHYTLPPVIGGVESCLGPLAEMFAKNGYLVTLLAGEGNFEGQNIKTSIIPEFSPNNSHVKNLQRIFRLGSLPESYELELQNLQRRIETEIGDIENVIIHNMMTMPFNLTATEAFWNFIENNPKKNFYIWTHDVAWLMDDYKNHLYKRRPWSLLKESLKEVTYISISEFRKRQMSELLNIPRKKIKVIPDVLKYQDFLRFNEDTSKVISSLSIFKKYPVNALRNIFQVTELGPRIVEFEAMLKKYQTQKYKNMGWTYEDAFIEAFNDAQDLTLNFTRSGDWGKKVNQSTAFFNAQVQGPSKIYRTFDANSIRSIIRGLGWITLPVLFFWAKNKDEEWYENLPPAYKYNSIFIMVGSNVYRIPLPFELGQLFGAAPLAYLENKYKKDPKAIEGLVRNIVGQLVPPIVPSMIDPWIDVGRNKNWLNQPIESEGMKYRPVEKRYRHYSTELSKTLSEGWAKIYKTKFGTSLGLKWKMSPVQIDYVLNSYTGGLFSRSTKGLEYLKTRDASDLLVIGRSILRMPEKPSRFVNDFYDRKIYLAQEKAAGRLTPAESLEYQNYNLFYQKYIKIQNKIITKYLEEDNREKLKSIYLDIGKKIRAFNKSIYANIYTKPDNIKVIEKDNKIIIKNIDRELFKGEKIKIK